MKNIVLLSLALFAFSQTSQAQASRVARVIVKDLVKTKAWKSLADEVAKIVRSKMPPPPMKQPAGFKWPTAKPSPKTWKPEDLKPYARLAKNIGKNLNGGEDEEQAEGKPQKGKPSTVATPRYEVKPISPTLTSKPKFRLPE